MNNLRQHFLLDPEVVFLNHGSFGATPKPVFESYQAWQCQLEQQPVHFMTRVMHPALKKARHQLGDYLHANGDDLIFVPNATFGVNVVARGLRLEKGDEVLTTDHEYGACDNAWTAICAQRGVHYVRQTIALPATTPADIVEQLWSGVTDKTKVIFLSHITSATALTFPVAAICKRAREVGILTVVDGAHAPGQLAVDLDGISADFYIGNLHKWVCAAKGAGFLYARPEVQPLLDPLVYSWDLSLDTEHDMGSPFQNKLLWWGTKDPAAYLSVSAALDFLAEHEWPTVTQDCHELVRQWLAAACELTGHPPLYPGDQGFFHQLAICQLPSHIDVVAFKNRLIDEFSVEIPVFEWQDKKLIRISVQGYNSADDVKACLTAMEALLS